MISHVGRYENLGEIRLLMKNGGCCQCYEMGIGHGFVLLCEIYLFDSVNRNSLFSCLCIGRHCWSLPFSIHFRKSKETRTQSWLTYIQLNILLLKNELFERTRWFKVTTDPVHFKRASFQQFRTPESLFVNNHHSLRIVLSLHKTTKSSNNTL